MLRVPGATIAALLLLGSAGGTDPRDSQDPEYTTLFLNVGPKVDKLVAEDLCGDGFKDLIVQSGKDLRVFIYRNGFKADPDQTLRLDPNVFLWHLARVGDPKSWSIITHTSRGLHRHAFSNGAFAAKPEDLVIHPNIFEGNAGDKQAPLFVNFTPDLNNDGLSDALLFQKDQIFIFLQEKGGGFKLKQKLAVPVDSQMEMFPGPHQKVKEVRAVPILTFGDQNGDGLPDIGYYFEEKMGVFYQNKDGTFAAAKTLALSADQYKRPGQFIKYEIPPTIADLNGDGLQDVILVYPSKGRVHIYYGRQGRTDFTEPDEVKKAADGWCTGVWARDLKGDGKLDLVMGVVEKFGIIGALKIFISGMVDIQLHVYLMQNQGKYTQDPVQVLKFSIPITFHVTRESASIDLSFRPNFDADINGDGLKDMLVEADLKTLLVYYGDRTTGISQKPAGKISINPPEGLMRTEVFVADFNNDRKSDLVLKHLGVEDRCLSLEVKLSK